MTHSTDLLTPERKANIEELWLQYQVESFYYQEMQLLDGRHFEEWFKLFSEDATYEAPLRVNSEGGADADISAKGRIFWESKQTLAIRVNRLQSEYAWAEQPPTRTRHFLTNVRVSRQPDGLINTRVNLLVSCNRGDNPASILYSAERKDTLSPCNVSGYLIRSRVVVVDHANMAGNALSIFL
ncbi:MAG: aromatic-ring-hydroxylating dioxygenase subunit beta [Acidimicrobiales bacterium]